MSHKCVLWQTMKIQMKCRIMGHIIRVYTICLAKNGLQRMKYNIYLEIIAGEWSIYRMDHPKFIVSNQKEESILVYKGLKVNFFLTLYILETPKGIH